MRVFSASRTTESVPATGRKSGLPGAALPRPKRTDPPGLPLPTDPRTWEPWRRRTYGTRFFAAPRPPLTEDQRSAVYFAARAVVRETMRALGLGRFPEQRWHDWLCRRAEAFARLSPRLRPRLLGPHDREWLRVYMRNWLYGGLRRTDPFLAECLPPEMGDGASPLDHPRAPWREWRLPRLQGAASPRRPRQSKGREAA